MADSQSTNQRGGRKIRFGDSTPLYELCFEPYPATDRKRKSKSADRAVANELERLQDCTAVPRTSKKPHVVSNVHPFDAE